MIRFDDPIHALRFMYGEKHMEKLHKKWEKLKQEVLGGSEKVKKGKSKG